MSMTNAAVMITVNYSHSSNRCTGGQLLDRFDVAYGGNESNPNDNESVIGGRIVTPLNGGEII